jgi:uncharacterized protein (TIGR02145 family)
MYIYQVLEITNRERGKKMKKTIMLLALFCIIACMQQKGSFTDSKNKPFVFTDSRDKKTYKTVEMPDGNIWMAENLNYTAGNSICYENKEENCKQCGRLYDWETAIKACPKDWHLPTDEEWEVLVKTIGGSSTAGDILKSKSSWSYEGVFVNGTDKHGFSAIACGFRDPNGSFKNYGTFANYWSATEGSPSNAWFRLLFPIYTDMGRYLTNKANLFSVRCMKN